MNPLIKVTYRDQPAANNAFIGAQIKLDEVIKLLTPLSKSHKVNDDNLINLLQYYELLNEIKNIHGEV